MVLPWLSEVSYSLAVSAGGRETTVIKFLANLFRGPSYIVLTAPPPDQNHWRFVSGQDSPRAEPAWDLYGLFGATSKATVVHGEQPGRYDVSVTFGDLNDEELRTVATISCRSHGFRNLTADDVRTLAAITRMEEFRREDR
jgi:hypothetical protein